MYSFWQDLLMNPSIKQKQNMNMILFQCKNKDSNDNKIINGYILNKLHTLNYSKFAYTLVG